MRPIIALLSDFGTRDHYAGVMKGVILGICSECTLVDVSHDLPAHDIPFASLELAATYKFFPAGTIFLAVVAPDNGVLTAVFQETPPKRVVELTERRYARPTVSRTFEGRDRFAPAAAWLAKGTQLQALGRLVTDYQVLDLPRPRFEEGVLRGSVVRVDRFGNVVTNLDRRSCERLADGTRGLQLTVRGQSIARLVSTYSDIAPGEIGALFGSTDHLECAAHAASAAEQLGVAVGDPVELRRA
jgi:S-adenosylmethionine hydrolase